VREGLKVLVNAQPDMTVVGEASTGREAKQQIRLQQPDVVIMDVSLPEGSGVETTAQVLAEQPQVRVLALTMHEDQSYLRALLEAGAVGYVLKRSAAEELIRAIRAVSVGGTYIDPAFSALMVENMVRPNGRSGLKGEIEGTPLSDREAEVLRQIARGYTNKEIAVRLRISIKTVETYKTRSMKKLNLDSRTDVVRYALQNGWLVQSDV